MIRPVSAVPSEAVKIALVELPSSRIVFATDYPQEIRAPEAVREFVTQLRALGDSGTQILTGNRKLLFKSETVKEKGSS